MCAMQQPSFEQKSASAVDQAPASLPGTTIRFGDAIKFAFRAENAWMNIIVSTLFALVPVAGAMAVAGWHAEIMQRLVRRHPSPIPTLEFSDFTHYLSRGVQPFIARVIVALPLSFVSVIVGFAAGVAGGIAARTREPTILIVVWSVFALILLVVMPIMIVIGSAVYTRADLVEDLSATFKMRELMAYMRTSWLTILGTSIVFGMISFGMILIGLVACYFGMFVASAMVQLGQVHMRWQLYERYVARGGERIQPKPPVWIPSEQARMQPMGYGR
jgi:hypothetical protein